MKVLLSEEQVQVGVRRMADEIARHYGETPLTILAVMTGSVVLLADIIRLLAMPLRVGVLQASSYRGGTQRGELVVNLELTPDVVGRDVLLIDDIFDTGHTLQRIVMLLKEAGVRSVRTAVLLRKTARCEVSLKPDFVGFDIPDEFVVGYGLDYCDAYRNLPFIAVLTPEEIARKPQ